MAYPQPGVSQQQPEVSADSLFYEFTPEEKKVMQECNRDSFYQRSLPLSLLLGAGTYMAINAGFLKRSLKWGPWPKAIGGGLLGYVIGKYSYQTECAERLMKIPNSELGRVLRERRGKANGERFQGFQTPTLRPGVPDTDVPSFATDYKSDIDIDTHKPMYSLDTDYRPNYDGLSSNNKDVEYQMSSYNSPTSYDELRARNRQEFERTQPNKPVYRPPPPSNPQPTWDSQYPPSDQTRSSQPRESRNQYGDVF